MGRKASERVEEGVIRVYLQIVEFLNKYDKRRRFKFSGRRKELFDKLVDKLKDALVDSTLPRGSLEVARQWIEELMKAVNEVKSTLKLRGVIFSREMKSFISDPRWHLHKKIFIYTHDLLRGRVGLAEYVRTASAAVRTSYKTNLRSIYQTWVLLTLLNHLGREGAKVVYPELRYLPMERFGKQKTGTIPPNFIIELPQGSLSFFIEAPRPIGWQDSRELSRSWKLYTALRPDFMVYSGEVMNILNLSADPPIARPDVIIECKELEDWYLRSRDVRGPFAKPLSAEEWRVKWLDGLWTGLASALGIERSEVPEVLEERKSLRLKEYRVVTLYRSFYKPREMFLISRAPLPPDVRRYLEGEGITVVDAVQFRSSELKWVAEVLTKYAAPKERSTLELSPETVKLLREALKLMRASGRDVDEEGVIREALKTFLRLKYSPHSVS